MVNSDLLHQIIYQSERLGMEIQTAKNLVNGKPIDADRKLQGILTINANILRSLYQLRETNAKLAPESNETVTDTKPQS